MMMYKPGRLMTAVYAAMASAIFAEKISNNAYMAAIELTPTAIQVVGKPYQNQIPSEFMVRNSGTGILNYRINANRSWLSATPTSGQSTGESDPISINYNLTGLTPGMYNATVYVTDPMSNNSPQTVTVNATVTIPQDLNSDGQVNNLDRIMFESCASGPSIAHNGSEVCSEADFDKDGDVDMADNASLQRCMTSGSQTINFDCNR